MKKNPSFFKRAQAMVLTLAMLMTLIIPFANLKASAESNESQSLSDGKIVAQNYALSNVEKELIASGFLTGKTHSYFVPDSNDGLITVDSDKKEIKAIAYEGTEGYTWNPVSAKICVGTEVKETVALENGKGTYAFAENAFSVVVEYALNIEVDADTQNLLLNAPKYLYDGLEILKLVNAEKANLFVLEEAMPTMYQMATSKVTVSTPFGESKVYFQTEAGKESAKALNAQLGEDGKFDLSVMLDEYAKAESKVEYLLKNGAALKEKVAETQKHIENIRKEQLWNVISLLENSGETAIYHTLLSALDNATQNLKTVSEKEWSTVGKTLVKENLTTLEFVALDAMVDQITSLTDISTLTIKNPLFASKVNVQYNMSMFDVKVTVALCLTDNTTTNVTYYQYGTVDTTVTLSEGATKADILAAIEATGIEADAKKAWGAAYVDGKFTAVTDELPAELKQDLEYTISYYPNLYKVTFGYGEQGSVHYPYGYIVKLENHEDAEKAYDYTVNGSYFEQGSSFKVTEETSITRKEGKAYNTSNLYQIVADNYLTDKGSAILTSGALFGNEAVSVRTPDNSNNIVTLSGRKLTALNYGASYQGLYWVPFSYTLSSGNTYLFDGKNEVEIPESFTKVTVNYRLYFKNFEDGKLIDIANIPFMLEEEAAKQLGALKGITDQKGNLEMLNSTMVTILAGLIQNTKLSDDAAKDAALKASFDSALNAIQAECMDGSNLKLFSIVSAYPSEKADNVKLLYYYNNNVEIRNEIAKLADLMTEMLGATGTLTAQDKIDALERLIRSLPSNIVSPDKVDEYVSKLTTLETTMAGVKSALSAPNAIIDLDSSKLGTLTAAIYGEGSTSKITSLKDKLCLNDSTIVMIASDKKAISVTLLLEGGKNTTVTSETVSVATIIDKAFVNGLKKAIADELASQSINANYYTTTYDASVFDALIGQVAGDITETKYEFTWTYKTFEVNVPDCETQFVSLDNKNIVLPASTDSAYRFDYYINGVKATGTTYTLSDAEFDKVVKGTFKVTKKSVYILRENLTNYVNSLNEAIAGDQVIFALVENDKGEFSIVLKIDASVPTALTSAIQSVAIGMVQGSYTYVGLNDSAFLADGSVHLQAVIDALMNSGFGVDTMLAAVDKNGNVINMTKPGKEILTEETFGAMGGKLMETTMQLGTTKEGAISLPFYVTLGAVNSSFVEVRNLFEEEISSLLNFTCEDGKLNVLLNMPEKLYEALLAVLLVTENITLNDINAVNSEITVTFINNLLMPLFKGDISVKTFENTLAKFGANYNLSSQKGAERLFSAIKSFYTETSFTYDEIGATTSANFGISSLIDSMNVGVLGNIIAEKETGINLNVRVALENLGNEYEAIYADVGADGITNKVGLTADLNKKLGEIAGTSAIVLLKDVKKDLTFNKNTLFNLNGFTVDGDLTANKKTIVIDSNLLDTKIGTVTGNVSGNITLVAGKYNDDVSEFVKNGYVQGTDGVVANQFYNISKDSAGNVSVELNANALQTRTMPNITGLAIDIACDLLFNGYTSNYLELDGKMIYNVSFEDIVGVYTSSNRFDSVMKEALKIVDSKQLSAFVNHVLDDVMDMTGIGEAIANGTPVFEYSIVTKPWNVEFTHVTDGDYITSSLVSGKKANSGMLKIFVVGDENIRLQLSEFFKELGKTITGDINLDISHTLNNKVIEVNASADASVVVDWTNPNYAIMFGVVIADGLSKTERTGLVDGIRAYYETGDITAFATAFNKLTTSQLLKAVKNLGRNDSFVGMVKALGLNDVVGTEVATLEAFYDKIGKGIAYLIRLAEIDGGSRTLGSYQDADGSYGFTREDMEKFLKKNLFRGYSLEANVAVTKAEFKIKLFDKKTAQAPEFVGDHGFVEILNSANVVGSLVDYDNMMIKLDAQTSGITVGEFKNLLKFNTNNADFVEITIGNGTGDDSLIVNGAKLTAVAKNNATNDVDVTEYTIIIMGDINCNGRVEVGDAVLISRSLVGDFDLNGVQVTAADNNCNGRTDIGDATRIATKIVDWNNYESMLNISTANM